MSGIPLLVEASRLRVLVVGGGRIATRKATQFADAGATVRIIATELNAEMEALVANRALHAERRKYERDDIGDAELVVAATNDRAVNAAISSDARAASRLVNAADLSDDGNFATMATHRRGALAIGVSTGGVPAAAIRIRDAIAKRFDARYADALHELRGLRHRLLASDDAALWRTRSTDLIDEDFCDAVEHGRLAERIASWP